MVKLKDLAAELDLSVTTVSRALNGFPEVNKLTRDRVRAAAERVGYRPNVNAKTLATGLSYTIGLAINRVTDHNLEMHFAEFLSGIGDVLAEANYDLLLIPFRTEDELGRYRAVVESKRVDAMIVQGPVPDDPRIAYLSKAGLPFVVHGPSHQDRPHPFIDIDNVAVGRMSAEHLLELGHQRIGLLNGPGEMNFARDRLSGHTDALVAAGVAVDQALIDHNFMIDTNGFTAAQRMMALDDPATAFIAGSMTSAIGAFRAIRTAGKELGNDVAMVAHDDVFPLLSPDAMVPTMTTTTSSMRDAGCKAAELALRALAGEPTDRLQILWPVQLDVRQSSGPARG